MKTAFDVLEERGFIEQMTHPEEIKELFSKEQVTFYIGFDPTASSLTVGHFLTVMAMAHLQQKGHRPIILMGGGTGMIGDPSGKSDMRRVMSVEEIDHNVSCFKEQLSKFIDFTDDKAIMVDNADWLRDLNYIEFLREIGSHFSVNRMLTAEAFKARMEKGLSFLEFNYMLMQAYDFLELNRRFDCKMELGGNDQWSNIIAGVDLIRRKESKNAYGMTFKLLTNSEGEKMGKTVKGAVWLDKERTSPYEFFQYWRNIDDKDVRKCLSLLTFLPMEEVERLSDLKDSEINKAKEVLAFELTKIVHSEEEATEALTAAKSVFGSGVDSSSLPKTEITKDKLSELDILTLLVESKLTPSKAEARRLVQQGGVKINSEKVDTVEFKITEELFKDNEFIIQKGKKVFHKIVLI